MLENSGNYLVGCCENTKKLFDILIEKNINVYFGVQIANNMEITSGLIYKKLTLFYPNVTIEDVTNAFLITEVQKRDFVGVTVDSVIAVIRNYLSLKNAVISVAVDLIKKEREEAERRDIEQRYINEIRKKANECFLKKQWTLTQIESNLAMRIMRGKNTDIYREIIRFQSENISEIKQRVYADKTSEISFKNGTSVNLLSDEVLLNYYTFVFYFEKI